MTLLSRFVLLVCVCLASAVSAQMPGPLGSPSAVGTLDDRTARVAERYKAMLLANPTEGLALDRLWKIYEERGAAAELIEESRRLAELPGAGVPAMLVYGHLLKKAGQLDEASAGFERARALDPGSPAPLLASAELSLARLQPEDAARLFTAALEKIPAGDRRQPEVLLKLGAAWMAAGEPLRAAESWERTVAQNPADLGLRRQLAETYEKNGFPDRALIHYEYVDAHAAPPERAAALRDLARLQEARGQFDAARDALERGLALTARDNWLHGDLETRLIRLYQRANRVPELESRWRAAADAAPRDLGASLRLLALAETRGDGAGARAELEKLVALAPQEREYTLKLARRLADDGDRTQAAALYDGLLKIQPDSLDLIFSRADLDLQLGRPASASNRIEARIARTPADESVTTPALAYFLDHHLEAAAEKRLRADAARQPAASEPALALAKFLYVQRKSTEARAVLDAMTSLPGEPAVRAARWTQTAEIFRAQKLAPEALQAWQEAATLQPRSAAPLLAAGEFLLARGDKMAGAERFRQAAALVTGPEQVDAEHKLFEVLQSSDATGEGRSETGGFLARPSGSPGAALRADQPLGKYLAQLEKTVTDAPTPDHFLTLARWQSWAGLAEAALLSAGQAVAVDPANVAARELVVSSATALHRTGEAETQLQELAARDPAHKNGYLRRWANLKMDDGEQDAAVAALAEVVRATPGSREAVTDLAMAQQRADRWFDAVGTWERASAMPGATPAQREEIRRPLLAAYERVGQFSRAAEVLRHAVDEQADLSMKSDLFRQLVAFCHRHDLGPGLREEYEKRLATRPDDYFLLTAASELRREDGQEREAYALLQRAFYSSPEPVRSLRELVDQAEELGEDAEAVAHQRQLAALPNQGTATNLERLATLEDASLDDVAAARTWENLLARFPRDTGVLGHAADFFQKHDQLARARTVLGQLIAVDESDTRRLLLLGNLDVQAGDVTAARTHLVQLLAKTTPEGANEPLTVPADLEARADASSLVSYGRFGGPARLRGLRGGAPVAPVGPENEERRLRLQAIEGFSRLLFPKDASPTVLPGEAQAAWLQRWRVAAKTGAKCEPLAAFYFSGQRDLTLDLLAGQIEPDAANGGPAMTAFLNAGLRLGGYQRLADWAWHGGDPAVVANRGQKLLTALQNFLSGGGKPGPGMVAELFPADLRVREVLWTAAQNGFAANHWYAPAAELGERVLATAVSGRAGYGLETAEWALYAGQPERAREALRRSIDDAVGDSLEIGNPVFNALRSYYLLLPENERAPFVQDYLGRLRSSDGPAHAALAAVVLHGLSGDTTAAKRDLDELLALRMLATEPATLSPDIRRWTYLLANGEQLRGWNLDELAIRLWRRALTEAGVFDLPISDPDNTVTEIRRRLLSAEVATASDPQQAKERIQEFLHEQPEPSQISAMAAQLWNDGQRDAAARLYEILCQSDPAITDYWPNLYTFYESTGDLDAAERLLTLMLAGPRALPAGVGRGELTVNLAALREKRGDQPGACRLLERARIATPGALPVLFQLAQTYERAGRWEEAASLWRESLPLDTTHTACLGLAAAEEHLGQKAAAAETLRNGLKSGSDPGRTELAVRLIQLLRTDHRVEEARLFASDLQKKGQLEPLPAMAAAFAANGQRAVARDVLAAAVTRSRDPGVRFHLQQALAEQYAVPDEDPVAFVKQMRRLERFAQASDALRSQYDVLLYPLAHQQGADAWAEGELQRAWKRGEGDPSAGVKLAGLYLQNHRDDALREVVQAIDHRPDLPENLLYTLATSLVEADHAPLALSLCERLANRFPQKQEYQLERARALWKSDRRPEANLLLARLAGSAVFREEVWEPIAAFYLEHSEKDRAAEFLERIVKNDPTATHAPQSWLQLAQIRLDQKRLPEAGRLLRIAYARPACGDLGPLVRYLALGGELENGVATQMPARDFPLTFARRARLLAAVREELNRNGRQAEGFRLIATHAEFLVATPDLAAAMRAGVSPASIFAVADCLERAVGQRALVPARLGHELAALYSQWAIWDANDPATRNDALAHLARAFELEPDNFSLACELAKVCLQQKQPERAAQVLAAFLAPDALPIEREQAQRILASL